MINTNNLSNQWSFLVGNLSAGKNRGVCTSSYVNQLRREQICNLDTFSCLDGQYSTLKIRRPREPEPSGSPGRLVALAEPWGRKSQISETPSLKDSHVRDPRVSFLRDSRLQSSIWTKAKREPRRSGSGSVSVISAFLLSCGYFDLSLIV